MFVSYLLLILFISAFGRFRHVVSTKEVAMIQTDSIGENFLLGGLVVVQTDLVAVVVQELQEYKRDRRMKKLAVEEMISMGAAETKVWWV